MRFSPGPLLLVLALALLVATASARAESEPDTTLATLKEELKRPQIQLFIENDVLAGSDRYYTNGFKLGGGAELPLVGPLLSPIPEAIINVLGKKGPEGETPRNNLGFFIGQNIYTPKNISIAENQPFDRPWAAWLYLGSVVQRVRGNRLDTVELDIGMVGPAALGKQVQSGWHELIGAAQPQGWSNQMPNEPAFMVGYLQKRRFDTSTIQIVPYAGITVGTVLTLARVGGDYRLVGRNIFLDGPMFRGSPNVNHRNAVHDLTAGFAFHYRQLNLSLTHIRRSEEFTTPIGGGGRQAFYSLNAGWQFD